MAKEINNKKLGLNNLDFLFILHFYYSKGGNKMRNCFNCYFARKAENKDYVGCIALISQNKNNANSDYTDVDILLNFYNRHEIATGWAFLHCKPNEDDGYGMITSGIPCFKLNDCCEHWRDNNKQ